jgi:hypothetical protein
VRSDHGQWQVLEEAIAGDDDLMAIASGALPLGGQAPAAAQVTF